MSGTTAIVIIAAALGLYGYLQRKGKKELRENGAIIDRPPQFYKYRELFHTLATYEAVVEKTKDPIFSHTGQTVEPDFGGTKTILIKSTVLGWNATIEYLGVQDGKQVFDFHFTTWSSQYGSPKNEINMNMMMTAVEKMFFEIDPSTMVETKKMEFETKTSFF